MGSAPAAAKMPRPTLWLAGRHGLAGGQGAPRPSGQIDRGRATTLAIARRTCYGNGTRRPFGRSPTWIEGLLSTPPYAAPHDDILVSCLTVTRGLPERFAFLRRSIAAYDRQTHRRRELVIVIHGGTAEYRARVADHVGSLNRDDIKIVEAPEQLRLGGLRRISRDAAEGAVHCQWDDDDFYHPERIQQQLAALAGSGAEGVCFQELMQYFPAMRTLYWTNWRATEATGHPGTLMCLASAPISYPEVGHIAQYGEDLTVLMQLKKRGALHLLANAAHLYVYVSHGANLWSPAHHRMLADRLAVSKGMLKRREAQLREGLSVFDFGPEPVTVQGSNGVAFMLGEAPQS